VPVACAVPEYVPGTPRLAGQLPLRLEPGSRAHQLYGRLEVAETYTCSFELNPAYRSRLEAAGLRFTGHDADGVARLFELPGHPFCLGTSFLPQLRSAPGAPHPLIAAFVAAARRLDRRP